MFFHQLTVYFSKIGEYFFLVSNNLLAKLLAWLTAMSEFLLILHKQEVALYENIS